MVVEGVVERDLCNESNEFFPKTKNLVESGISRSQKNNNCLCVTCNDGEITKNYKIFEIQATELRWLSFASEVNRNFDSAKCLLEMPFQLRDMSRTVKIFLLAHLWREPMLAFLQKNLWIRVTEKLISPVYAVYVLKKRVTLSLRINGENAYKSLAC